MKPKYPNIKVQLTGQDGNAYSLMGIVQEGLRRNKVSDEEIQQFHTEATSGDYDHLLQTCMRWVVCN